ncbi:MAG: SOS response-associated peptidase family protein, partial [Planctomycetaceae bacterium]
MPSLILLQIVSDISRHSADDDCGLLFLFAAASRISGYNLLLANGAKIPSPFFQKNRLTRKITVFLVPEHMLMCGRYTLKTSPQQLMSLFQVPFLPDLVPRYNIAPTQPVLVIRAVVGGEC